MIVNSGLSEGPCSEVSDDVLRPMAAVEGAECTNGMGRREALLIQTIAAGIERTDAADPVISPDPTMNAADHPYPLSSTGHVVF